MKPTNQNFKLSKESKRLLATVSGAHNRGEIKRMLMVSELATVFKPKPVSAAPGTAKSVK